ncbi:ferredoxin reductase [Aquipluma nitroreducens]|uniref:Ferredoxin reductase n=1 Tax=Aquipluma nitroreducens TaxID=2010828 RepID=A0A5K7SET8_9BACT|nr:flavodoxin reductase [Aquipluma nitroreducens]BBE20142.1 ferredoxin reductase [Aquipluma nitroreducens]
MQHIVKIIEKSWLTHDVLCLRLERPLDYSFYAGQAIEVSLENPRFQGENAPFTLTGLSSEKYLELILKVYAGHNGMTLEISKLKQGDQLMIGDAWDSYKNLGPGMFIAGGTGITPCVALLRQLNVENRVSGSKLLFANKTEKDILLFEELCQMLGQNFINILSREKKNNFLYGHINLEVLKNQISKPNQPFYICGPGNFAEQIRDQLLELGIHKDMINISY